MHTFFHRTPSFFPTYVFWTILPIAVLIAGALPCYAEEATRIQPREAEVPLTAAAAVAAPEEETAYDQSFSDQDGNQPPDAAAEIRINFDNDLFIKNAAGGDRGYTNGIRLSAVWPMSIAPSAAFGRWRKDGEQAFFPWLLRLLDEEGIPARPFIGVALGQAMFTPLDLEQREIIVDDRPYAGWLYVGGLFSLRGPLMQFDAELDVGATGEASFAEQSQRFVHELTNSTEPKGWDNQISSGLGLNLYLKGQGRVFNVEFPRSTGVPIQVFDGQFLVETALGNFLNSQALGIYTRSGWIKKAWVKPNRANGEGLTDRKIPSHIHNFGTDLFQLYVFARLQSEFVLYNATIQGLPWSSNEHTLAIMPLVHEGETGVVFQPINMVEITFSATHRTQETREGRFDGGGHTYGHLQLGLFWY